MKVEHKVCADHEVSIITQLPKWLSVCVEADKI